MRGSGVCVFDSMGQSTLQASLEIAGFRVSGFGFRVSGLGFRVRSFHHGEGIL